MLMASLASRSRGNAAGSPAMLASGGKPSNAPMPIGRSRSGSFLARAQCAQHAGVVDAAMALHRHDGFAAHFVQRVFELGLAIGGIDGDEDQPRFRRRELRQRPLRATRRPDADAVARRKTHRQQSRRQRFRLRVQLGIGPADGLVARDQRRPRAVETCGVLSSAAPMVAVLSGGVSAPVTVLGLGLCMATHPRLRRSFSAESSHHQEETCHAATSRAIAASEKRRGRAYRGRLRETGRRQEGSRTPRLGHRQQGVRRRQEVRLGPRQEEKQSSVAQGRPQRRLRRRRGPRPRSPALRRRPRRRGSGGGIDAHPLTRFFNRHGRDKCSVRGHG